MLYNQDWNVDEVGKLLLRAADVIEQRGHTKNTLVDINGSVCAVGAMYAIEGNTSLMREAASRVSDAFGLNPSHPTTPEYADWYALVDWNNAEERTGQEVIDAFRSAARLPVAEVKV